MLNVHASCPCSMTCTHAACPYPCCLSIMHDYFCMSKLDVYISINAPCPCSMLHVQAVCPCCMNILREHEQEHTNYFLFNNVVKNRNLHLFREFLLIFRYFNKLLCIRKKVNFGLVSAKIRTREVRYHNFVATLCPVLKTSTIWGYSLK
jgi:hypothetical protein